MKKYNDSKDTIQNSIFYKVRSGMICIIIRVSLIEIEEDLRANDCVRDKK